MEGGRRQGKWEVLPLCRRGDGVVLAWELWGCREVGVGDGRWGGEEMEGRRGSRIA